MLRTSMAIGSLIVASVITGGSLQARFAGWIGRQAHPSTSEYLAFNAPAQSQNSQPSQETVNAMTADQITQLKENAQADRDDRKAIHDQIYQLAQTENEHYNALQDRMDVDEARFYGGGSVIGALLVLLNAVMVFLSWRDRHRNPLKETP